MSEIAEIIDTLENRIKMLVSKLITLEHKIELLEQEKTTSVNTIQKQSDEIEVLKKQCETLRLTNALLGSDEFKRDTKLKINSLIREIDYCIAQLSD